MKFAHIADVHIGSWKDPHMLKEPDKAFEQAIHISLEEEVDFILIAGDLFDSAVPGIDQLKSTVRTLRKARKNKTPIYLIPGSHDFSPSGKTMLAVLEESGLCINVNKGEVREGKLHLSITTDKKTGAHITGILGKKGMLDSKHYEELAPINPEPFSIFMFHTSLDELKPKELSKMQSHSAHMLPTGFDYYAGGHVHITDEVSLQGYKHIVYPGPVYPANFSELETLTPSMVIYENGRIRRLPLRTRKVIPLTLTAHEQTPQDITAQMIELIEQEEHIQNSIVLIRVKGSIKDGIIGDIDMRRVRKVAEQQGAHTLLRNTTGLQAHTNQKKTIHEGSTKDIEEKILQEHLTGTQELQTAKQLLQGLSIEKQEGETKATYEERILTDARKVLELD